MRVVKSARSTAKKVHVRDFNSLSDKAYRAEPAIEGTQAAPVLRWLGRRRAHVSASSSASASFWFAPYRQNRALRLGHPRFGSHISRKMGDVGTPPSFFRLLVPGAGDRSTSRNESFRTS